MSSQALNQKIRDKIAHRLTVDYAKSAATQLRADALRAADLFWHDHEKRVTRLVADDPEKWASLMSHGVYTRASFVQPEISENFDTDGETRPRWVYAVPLDARTKDDHHWLQRVLGDSEIALIGSHEPFQRARTFGPKTLYYLTFMPRRKPLPMLADMDKITTKAMVARLEDLSVRTQNLVGDLKAFYRDTMRILESCRSSKQLEDVFPEAAKLMPEKKTKGNQMIAQESINHVRQMLKQGAASTTRP